MFTHRDVVFPTAVITQTQSVLAPTPSKVESKVALSKINVNLVKELSAIIDKSSKTIGNKNKKAILAKIRNLQKTLQKHPDRTDIKLEIIELQRELRKK